MEFISSVSLLKTTNNNWIDLQPLSSHLNPSFYSRESYPSCSYSSLKGEWLSSNRLLDSQLRPHFQRSCLQGEKELKMVEGTLIQHVNTFQWFLRFSFVLNFLVVQIFSVKNIIIILRGCPCKPLINTDNVILTKLQFRSILRVSS